MNNNECNCGCSEPKKPKGKQKCTCGDRFKREYEEYLRQEECNKKEDPPFDLCDYDPDAVYFLQYRPKARKKKPLD